MSKEFPFKTEVRLYAPMSGSSPESAEATRFALAVGVDIDGTNDDPIAAESVER
jgi:hypothetical protein